MRRREFIGLVGAAATWPLAARAQQAAKSYRVAYLGLLGDQDAVIIKQRLDELGYTEGRNLIFDFGNKLAYSIEEPIRTEVELRPHDDAIIKFRPFVCFQPAARLRSFPSPGDK